MDSQRNLLLAIVVSAAILLAWQFFFEKPRMERQEALMRQTQQEAAPAPGEKPAPGETAAPGAPEAARPAAAFETRAEALASGPRVRIKSPRIDGSIALKGARIDDVRLVDYRVAVDPKSPEVDLLNPSGTANAYFAEYGWVPQEKGLKLPDETTLWRADADVLTPGHPVTLTYDDGRGLVFKRVIALDDNYMFTVTQTVENHTRAPVTLFPYALISRTGTPQVLGYYILHEGPLGVLDGTLHELKYKDLKEKKLVEYKTTGGWLGITDKYWLAALIPDQHDSVQARFSYTEVRGTDKYQTDFLGSAATIAPGASAETTSRLFAGAKEVRLLDHYADTLGIPRFDLAVDFGWFYFLTKPIFYVLNTFHEWLGNFGLAILLLTVLIKLLFFPLANKSYRAMSKMKALQPEILKLRELYPDDRQRLNQEMMELYKREKVNPTAGCLPIVIQIPVFFALYKVLFVTIEMRHAPFYGWIRDLSAPDPSSVLTLFGTIPWDPSQYHLQFLNIGVWPIIMGITMLLQQRMNPPPDPVQARMFLMMPVVFTFLLAHFPAGLVIYWAWNNILSIAQQWVIMRQTLKAAAT
jgi:YidC/Oxa1 family membrane protein insertase